MDIDSDKAKQGLKTAVSELHDPADPVPGGEEVEQLQLPDLPLDNGGARPGNAVAVRGPGRPLGAKNKNTEAWRKFILSQHRSPLEALAQTYSMSIADLGRRLGLLNAPTFDQALELLKVQLAAARDLAPYVHQKMPLAVEGGENGLIQLVINQGAATQQAGPDAVEQAIEILNEPSEENQLVTDADFTESNKTESNENE